MKHWNRFREVPFEFNAIVYDLYDLSDYAATHTRFIVIISLPTLFATSLLRRKNKKNEYMNQNRAHFQSHFIGRTCTTTTNQKNAKSFWKKKTNNGLKVRQLNHKVCFKRIETKWLITYSFIIITNIHPIWWCSKTKICKFSILILLAPSEWIFYQNKNNSVEKQLSLVNASVKGLQK